MKFQFVFFMLISTSVFAADSEIEVCKNPTTILQCMEKNKSLNSKTVRSINEAFKNCPKATFKVFSDMGSIEKLITFLGIENGTCHLQLTDFNTSILLEGTPGYKEITDLYHINDCKMPLADFTRYSNYSKEKDNYENKRESKRLEEIYCDITFGGENKELVKKKIDEKRKKTQESVVSEFSSINDSLLLNLHEMGMSCKKGDKDLCDLHEGYTDDLSTKCLKHSRKSLLADQVCKRFELAKSNKLNIQEHIKTYDLNNAEKVKRGIVYENLHYLERLENSIRMKKDMCKTKGSSACSSILNKIKSQLQSCDLNKKYPEVDEICSMIKVGFTKMNEIEAMKNKIPPKTLKYLESDIIYQENMILKDKSAWEMKCKGGDHYFCVLPLISLIQIKQRCRQLESSFRELGKIKDLCKNNEVNLDEKLGNQAN